MKRGRTILSDQLPMMRRGENNRELSSPTLVFFLSNRTPIAEDEQIGPAVGGSVQKEGKDWQSLQLGSLW